MSELPLEVTIQTRASGRRDPTMKLTGKERQAIHHALLHAFPSISDLTMLLSFSMDQRLDSIVSPSGSLSEAVFELLVWAESHGSLEELLTQALASNPGNSALRSIVQQLGLATPSRAQELNHHNASANTAGGELTAGRDASGLMHEKTTVPSRAKRSYRFRRSVLSLEFGDITSSSAEVLVSSDDYYLSMGGGVSRAILRAGGQSIALEAAKAAPAAAGEVIVTGAGQLAARHIFHAVTIGPGGMNPDARDILRRIISRCFQLVDALGVRSVAFPALGTGVAHFPLDETAALMAELIVNELERRTNQLDVTVYLMDRSGERGPTDYIVFFEQFASRAPRVAVGVLSEPAAFAVIEPSSTRILATTADQVRAQRIHQIYSLLAQVHEQRYKLEQLLIERSTESPTAERTTVDEQLAQNEELKRRFLGELDELNRTNGVATGGAVSKVQTVFVSSTYSDLKEHRSAVKDQITKRGLLFKGMELFGADPEKTPATLIVEEVRQADAFLGIVGARYGFIDGATGLSMTELEFNAARAAGKQMLLYVMDDDAPVPFKDIEKSADGKTKLDALRTRIMREHVVAKFTSADDLAGKVFADLGKLSR